MDSQIEVTQARQQLLDELARVRTSLREAMARYKELAAEIKGRRAVIEKLRTQLKAAIELVTAGTARRPRIADILPDDPEARAWQERQQELEHQRDEIIARIKAAPDPDEHLIEAIRYEDQTGVICTLQRAEANLMRSLDPEADRRWREGGVFHVG